jgi:hypothetical protein
MDMKTFKFLEFAAIFGVLGWFWWSQRQSRPEREEQSKDDGAPEEPVQTRSEVEETAKPGKQTGA